MADETYRIDVEAGWRDNASRPMSDFDRRVQAAEAHVARLQAQLAMLQRQGNRRIVLDVLNRAMPALQGTMRMAQALTRAPWRLTVNVVGNAASALQGLIHTATSFRTLMIGYATSQAVRWPLELAGNVQVAEARLSTYLSKEQIGPTMEKWRRQARLAGMEFDDLAAPMMRLLGASNGNLAYAERMGMALMNRAAGMGIDPTRVKDAVVGINQLAGSQVASAEEFRQIWEPLELSASRIINRLGMPGLTMQNMAERGVQPEDLLKAIQAELEMPLAQGGGAGGMEQRLKTWPGMLAFISKSFQDQLITPLGQGVVEAFMPQLEQLNKWLIGNESEIMSWGNTLKEVSGSIAGPIATNVAGAVRRLREITTSPAWANASGGDRANMLWQNLIVAPFDSWWAAGGEAQVQKIAGQVGGALGGAIGGTIGGALGLAEGSNADNTFVKLGRTAGQSFQEEFIKALNPQALLDRLMAYIKDPANWFGNMTWDPNKSALVPTNTVAAAQAAVAATGRTAGNLLGRPDAVTGKPGSWDRDSYEGGGGGGGAAGGAAGVVTPHQFADQNIRAEWNRLGLTAEAVAVACAPIVAAGLVRAGGQAATEAEMAFAGEAANVWSRTAGATNRGEAIKAMLASKGLDVESLDAATAMQRLAAGQGVSIDTPGSNGHYFLGTGVDAQGRVNVGNTGLSAKGGSAAMTLEQIAASRGVGVGDLQFQAIKAKAEAQAAAQVSGSGPDFWAERARQAAARHGIDPEIFRRQMAHESGNFAPDVVSGQRLGSSGEIGVAQFMPMTAAHVGVNPADPEASLEAAAKLMAQYQAAYGVEDALRAYNAGPGAIERSRGYKSTNGYVEKIMRPNEHGGVISEPVTGVGHRSGATYSFAEHESEEVVPRARRGGGGANLNFGGITVNANQSDLDSATGRLKVASQLVPTIAEILRTGMEHSRRNRTRSLGAR